MFDLTYKFHQMNTSIAYIENSLFASIIKLFNSWNSDTNKYFNFYPSVDDQNQ